MSPGEIRSSGLVPLVVGVGMTALVVPAWLVLLPAGGPSIPLLVISLVMALCLAAAGALALWIVDVSSAVRLRRWFVALEGVALVSAYPLLWGFLAIILSTDSTAESVGAGAFVLLVTVPMLAASRVTRAVHLFVAAANGPLVPGDGEGAPAQRIRSLGTLLVVLGAALAIGAPPLNLAQSLSIPRAVFLSVFGAAVGVCVVLLGARLMRVTDVYSARRINPQASLAIAGAFAIFGSGSTFGGLGTSTAASVVLGLLLFGGLGLIMTVALTLRGYTGEWDRPWPERLWGIRSKGEVSR